VTAQALQDIRWGRPFIPDTPLSPELVAEAKQRLKKVPEFVSMTGASPWLTRLMFIWEERRAYAQLDATQINIVALVTAQENACRFCYGMQRALMKILGYSESQIRCIERDSELGDARTKALVDFCRKLAQSNPRPARAEREALERFGFSQDFIAELVFEVGINCFMHRVASFLAAQPVAGLERASNRWWSVFLRPVLAIKVRPKRITPRRERGSGPFGPVLSALSGTGAQPILGEMAEHLLSPSALSRRTKLLMMATIARAMACPYCQGVATNLLVDDELSTEDIADVLDTLESPKLSAVEAKLLPFARATIRYEPYKMQERTAQLAVDLGPELALEAVGVTAMANMMVRLVMLLA
jgi:alkylhydroperoxidase family enzyme